MLYKITQFIHLCRSAGLTIASSEIVDLLTSIELLGWQKERLFFNMSATIVKEEKDLAALKKLFNLFFYTRLEQEDAVVFQREEMMNKPPCWEPGKFIENFIKLKNTITIEKAQYQEKCNSLGGQGMGGSGSGRPLKPALSTADQLLLLLKKGEPDFLKAFIKGQVDQLKALKEQNLPKFSVALQELKVIIGLAEVRHRLSKQKELSKDSESIVWQENEKLLKKIMRRELEEALMKKWPQESIQEVARHVNAKEMDFNLLDEEQVEEIRNSLRRLAHRLATRNSYRYARARRGMIDLRRTASKAVQTGGVPLLLCCRQRIPDRPEIVVIYDLSGSVALFSEFILQLVYALHKSFNKVYSFAFIDCIAETTSFIKGENINWEIRQILEKTKIAKTNFSNYGQVWQQFARQYINIITRETIVLVLGDARNNWNPANEEYFAQISEVCRKLIWLNPSPKEKWSTEDCIINIYEPYCQYVFECRNLKQLESAMQRIF
ncbi:VWA containing CoxE family protein [Desulfofarcimen acetoxidans DSM 771]|uniref:VWA containing CoxE family protein n=1 Tax=Desulfofarcimen acetoxidans (strain ATCC 49208 / DSM 771 / KCTC 5769 / VKM B-1644 / 5575) TaxID=485916 RepID=C8W5G4_DESAS|nr:VWA domain-containing protein [Desulfofarcimen acetoxidans]ACV62146.1 VWA containing CoxE family protein [Desulfofarcimen acetoxidans DSM 771]